MSAYMSLIGRRRGWALINFFCLYDECLFKVGANLRLGAYSNKYGNFFESFLENGARKKKKNKLRHHHVISFFPSFKQLLSNKFPVKSSVCL